MFTHRMVATTVSAGLLALLSACGQIDSQTKQAATAPVAPAAAASESPETLALHRRAVEAVIWGMPAVNFDLMLQAAIANGAKPNQLVYWSQPVNWKNQTLTPNPDTIYLNPFYDTHEGPVVIEVPPVTNGQVIVGSIDEAWQNALVDVGPAGADRGKGGKYLITPPGYKDKPPAGYTTLQGTTYQGFAIMRSNFKSRSEADISAAVEHGKRIKVYPLSAGPSAAVAVDVYDKSFDATIKYDWRFFESLHRFVQAEPWATRDKVMIEMLKSLGIEKGKPFAPDDDMKAVFDAAAREAHEYIAMRFEKMFDGPFWEGTRWAVPVPQETLADMQNGFSTPDVYAFDGRAIMYHMAYFSAKQLGQGQFYIFAVSDDKGQRFDGRKTYKLTVPANAPVQQYWSATMYDAETHALIRETSHSSRASTAVDLKTNADGSVTIYFGPKAPDGQDGNWVPTHDRPWEVIFRLYGPDKSFFDKAWKLPDIEATSG